ncbi:MAG: NUDIX hydrolase [Clostridia bacterium]|nr:NUDIX hydrolase [Clostridia bacterium]
MENKKTQTVAAVCIKENKVLCIEHVFGKAERIIDIPCGEVLENEQPWDAVKRIVMEQANIEVKAKDLLGVKFGNDGLYSAFEAEYIAGESLPEQRIMWIPKQMVCLRIETPDITKKMIKAAQRDLKIKEIDCDELKDGEKLFGIR